MAFEVESYFKEKLQRLASVCVSEAKLEAAVGAAWWCALWLECITEAGSRIADIVQQGWLRRSLWTAEKQDRQFWAYPCWRGVWGSREDGVWTTYSKNTSGYFKAPWWTEWAEPEVMNRFPGAHVERLWSLTPSYWHWGNVPLLSSLSEVSNLSVLFSSKNVETAPVWPENQIAKEAWGELQALSGDVDLTIQLQASRQEHSPQHAAHSNSRAPWQTAVCWRSWGENGTFSSLLSSESPSPRGPSAVAAAQRLPVLAVLPGRAVKRCIPNGWDAKSRSFS